MWPVRRAEKTPRSVGQPIEAFRKVERDRGRDPGQFRAPRDGRIGQPARQVWGTHLTRLMSASSRFCLVRRCRNGFRFQKLLSGEDAVLAAAVVRLRGEQPGRENNSSRLLRCHEPNLRHASNFVVSTVVRWEILRECRLRRSWIQRQLINVHSQSFVRFRLSLAGVLLLKTGGAGGNSTARLQTALR